MSRFIMECFYSYIPTNLESCHKCDNPRCVNPEHLFLGTHLENMQDSSRKGRNRSPQGTVHHSNKLSEEDVLRLRSTRKELKTKWSKLGKMFGITAANARKTCLGLKWSWFRPDTFAQ